MGKFLVFCLTTVGVVTTLGFTAAAGAAGLYYWHGEGGSLPRHVRIVTESGDRTHVYDISPDAAEPGCPSCADCRGGSAAASSPAPVPLAASTAPAVDAAPLADAGTGPTAAQFTELKARLAAALERLAALEAARAPASVPQGQDF